jgi:hypothetical protein
MASARQAQAAKQNVKKAQQAATRKRTIARLPKSTRSELGKQAAQGRQRGGKRRSLMQTTYASARARMAHRPRRRRRFRYPAVFDNRPSAGTSRLLAARICAPYAVRGTAEDEVQDENVSLAADRSPFRRSK